MSQAGQLSGSAGRAGPRVPELDGIRGIAILLVLVLHFGLSVCPTEQVRQVVSFGWAGVDLFFVLSGFLITGILLESAGTAGYLRNFYVRRALRIFPVYYVFLILFFHVGPLLSRIPALSFLPRGRGEEWWYWFYLSNLSPFEVRNERLVFVWSLCVEEQFYLFFPLVVKYCSRRTLKTICLSVVALSPLLRYVSAEAGVSPYSLFQGTVFRLDGLAMGAVLALARDDAALRGAIQRWSGAVSCAAVAILSVVLWRHGSNFISEPMLVWGHSALALLSGALIFHAALFPWPLRLWWLRSSGKYSYAIYVWHSLLAENVAVVTRGFRDRYSASAMWLVFAGCVVGGIVASCGMALLSWHVIEEPFARLKSRFAPMPRGSGSLVSKGFPG